MAGLATVFGSGAMTNSFSDFEIADAIFVIGSNTTENHPIAGLAIKKAKRNGTILIVADPRKIKLTQYADIWLEFRPGTDIALVNGIAHVIYKENLYNHEFIKERTEGFEEYTKLIEEYTPDKVAEITGVKKEILVEAARVLGKADKAVIAYAMGITQHVRGTDNVLSLANLTMLIGNVGKPGTGLSPLRGQNNVQGACDMGALPDVLPGYVKVASDSRKKFEDSWKVSIADKPGLSVVKMMQAAEESKLKGMYIMGENPMLTDPRLEHVKEALNNLEFLIVQDIFLTETAGLADVVLPAASFAEKEGTFTNTERRVLKVNKAIDPPGETKEDWKIIVELAKRMGVSGFDFQSPQGIMDEINLCVPQYAGIKYHRLEGSGIQWPCPSSEHPGTERLHENSFARGKGLFIPIGYMPSPEMPDKEFPFVLITGRMLHHYHTSSMTGRTHLKMITKTGFVFINPDDAKNLNIADEEEVTISSRHGRLNASVKFDSTVPPGILFSTFHSPDLPINVITSEQLDEKSETPQIKTVAVKLMGSGLEL